MKIGSNCLTDHSQKELGSNLQGMIGNLIANWSKFKQKTLPQKPIEHFMYYLSAYQISNTSSYDVYDPWVLVIVDYKDKKKKQNQIQQIKH